MLKEITKSILKGSPLESIARSAFSKFRYYARPREYRMNRAYDERTIQIMSRILSSTSNCIDVGCHTGSALVEIISFAPNGTHYAFEPIPELAKDLREKFPQINVYEMALSDMVGETTFQLVLDYPAYSGIRKRSYPQEDTKIKEIMVKTDKLDNIIPDNLQIDFIKVDVEGAEFQVLSGAKNIIKKYKPYIVFEHGIGGSDHYGTTPEMMFNLLVDQCGLKISLLPGWLKNKHPLTRKDFIKQGTQGPNWYFLAHK